MLPTRLESNLRLFPIRQDISIIKPSHQLCVPGRSRHPLMLVAERDTAIIAIVVFVAALSAVPVAVKSAAPAVGQPTRHVAGMVSRALAHPHRCVVGEPGNLEGFKHG